MKILINYADEAYEKTQMINSASGKKIGKFDKVFSYSPKDIDTSFLKKNEKIFKEKRGNGLWLWKPYFINKALEESNDGDYLFYCDSGSFFIRSIDNLIISMRKNEYIWVSDNPLLECCFTKKKCFEKMDCTDDSFLYSNQIQGGFVLMINSPQTREFIREWLQLCTDFDLLSTEDNSEENRNSVLDFVSHREDQSILSLLCKKKGIKAHKDPSHRGYFVETFYNPSYKFLVPNHPDDKYKPILFLHKHKQVKIFDMLKVLAFGIICKYRYRRVKQGNDVV